MGVEFSDKQIKRIDEVENAAFDFAKILTENPDLKWDMSFIGDIADCVAGILVKHGFRVRYPAIVEDHGEQVISDYFD